MIADKYERYRSDLNFIKRYWDAQNAASGSDYDPNSNVSSKNNATLAAETGKRARIYTKRLAMWEKLNEMYGEETADGYIADLESHRLYCHDETSVVGMPYCASITLYPFLMHGLSGLGGTSDAPKHLDSFAGSFVNLVFAASAQVAGAIATPEFLPYLNYFLVKEYGMDYYKECDKVVDLSSRQRTIADVIDDTFAQVVYSVNQPSAARGNQSVFWNVAYFDEPYFHALFEDFVFPDGTRMIDLWEPYWWLQCRFMEWFNNERLRKPLTFPVESFSLLNDGKDCVDQRAKDFVCKMYEKGHSFFTYTSDSVDSLASCCFSKDTEVIIKVGLEIIKGKIGNLYDKYKDAEWIEVPGIGKWKEAEFVRLPSRKMYRVIFSNSSSFTATDNHLWPTSAGDLRTDELRKGSLVKCAMDVLGSHYDVSEYNSLVEDGSISFIDGIPYLKVCKIEPVEYDDPYVYCFECEDQSDPYFVLPYGAITHNCRLRNGISENTFSYSLGAGGIATGSKCVMTININRLVQDALKGYDYATLDEELELIRKRVDMMTNNVHKYLSAFNALVKDAQAHHMIPLYDAGFVTPEKQYLTVGVNGFVEGAEFLGIEINDNPKYSKYVDTILGTIYELNKRDRTKDMMFNTEFVPSL